MREYELKLADGHHVHWHGKDGEDACQQYADNHPGTSVVAWRHPRVALVVGVPAGAVF